MSQLSISLEKTLCREKKQLNSLFLEWEHHFSTRGATNYPDKVSMTDATFAEILENFTSENTSEVVFSPEVSSTLEPAFLSHLMGQMMGELSVVRAQNHSVSSYSRAIHSVRASEFKLKSQGMTETQFKAYEFLLFALELPILKAHCLFPEGFTLLQLKKAYKLAALKNHPDGGGCHESFLEIKKCYDILEGFVKT